MAKAIIVISVLLILGLACGLYFGIESQPVSLTLLSPNNTYTVQLNENVDRFLLPTHLDPRKFNEVRFSAFKSGQTLTQNEELWRAESTDARFFDLYQYHWVTDSVLKFGWDTPVPQSKMDEVVVSNDTNQPVTQLVIRAHELFLILDLQPKTSVIFSASPQAWLSWIDCRGNFSSGQPIAFDGANFFIRDNQDTHVSQHYCISILDAGVLIQSREVEGYKDVNGIKTTIPKCSNNRSTEVVYNNQR